MYISKFELKNIRGVGPEGLTVDLAKPAIKGRGRLAGWTVIAGPNGYGKTTVLQGIAASLMGPAGGRLLIGPDDNRWLALDARTGTTTTWVERTPEDDGASPEDETLKPVRLRVDWSRGGGVRTFFPRGNHNFIYTQFWDAFNVQSRPRASAIVSLFRDDAALEKGHGWLKGLALGMLRGDEGKDTVLGAVLIILGDKLLNPEHVTSMTCNVDGVLRLRAPSGLTLSVSSLGDGYRMLINMILDILYQIERFKPGRILHGMRHLPDSPKGVYIIRMSGVIVIDEPENHLHPALQQHIGFWLKKHFPNIQFIVCTHSALICQAADKGALFRMPAPFQVEAVDEDTWEAVTNGTLDDAIMTELFGLTTPVAPEGQKLRKELGESSSSRSSRTPSTSRSLRR